jgi:hypothetical protein
LLTELPEAGFFLLSTYPRCPQRKKKVAKKKETIIIAHAHFSIRIESPSGGKAELLGKPIKSLHEDIPHIINVPYKRC